MVVPEKPNSEEGNSGDREGEGVQALLDSVGGRVGANLANVQQALDDGVLTVKTSMTGLVNVVVGRAKQATGTATSKAEHVVKQ